VKEAQFNLSNLHEEGAGASRDTRAAVALLESAAASGDITAMFNPGVLYATGRDDLPRDTNLDVQCYGRAADKGYASAQYNLAGMYAQGTGVQTNFFQTRRWLSEAAKKNHAKALMDLGTLQAEGIPDQKDLTMGVKSMSKAQDIDKSIIFEVNRRMQLICGREAYQVAVSAGCLNL
jgi:TPR repeat protein